MTTSAGSRTNPYELAILADRQAIADCIARYCRAVDRMDRELLLSVYHPDAVHDQTGAFRGGPEEFADWLWANQADREAVQHVVSNIQVDLDGEDAHSETYFTSVIRRRGTDETSVSIGRYLDRLERRESGWRIAHRIGLIDFRFATSSTAGSGVSRRDRTDPSYRRPLDAPGAAAR